MTREHSTLIDELILCGQRLSNFAWNHGTNKLQSTQETFAFACELAHGWDAARKAARPAVELMHNLPLAFDPIELGA